MLRLDNVLAAGLIGGALLTTPAAAHTIAFDVESGVQCTATLFQGTTATPLGGCHYDLPTNAPPTDATLRFELRQSNWSRDVSLRLLSAYLQLETSHRLRYPAAPSAVALPSFIAQRQNALLPLRTRHSLTWSEAQMVWETLFWADRVLNAQPAVTHHLSDINGLNKLLSDSCEHLLTKTPSRSLLAPSITLRIFPYCDSVSNVMALATDSTWLAVPFLEQTLASNSALSAEYRLAAYNDTLAFYEVLSANSAQPSRYARTQGSIAALRNRVEIELLGQETQIFRRQTNYANE